MYTQTINQLRRAAGAITRGTVVLGLTGLLVLSAVAFNDAEARRMGGGQSIGRQSQMASPSGQGQRSQPAQPAQQTQSAQQSTPAPQTAPAGNRWMGPLAGIAAGFGIAALLSSFGLAEGLAQMLSNALLIGLVIFAAVMLFRFIANRRRPDLAYGRGVADRPQTNGLHLLNPMRQAQPETDLRGAPRASMDSTGALGAAGAAGTIRASGSALELDQAAFLASAKTMFMRLQDAWARTEQGDLFELTTPQMFARIKLDLEDRGRNPSRADVTQLDAEVLGVERNATETLVSVRFYGHMREDDTQTAQPFQEVWNMLRDTAHGDQAWRLAGIQQIVHSTGSVN